MPDDRPRRQGDRVTWPSSERYLPPAATAEEIDAAGRGGNRRVRRATARRTWSGDEGGHAEAGGQERDGKRQRSRTAQAWRLTLPRAPDARALRRICGAATMTSRISGSSAKRSYPAHIFGAGAATDATTWPSAFPSAARSLCRRPMISAFVPTFTALPRDRWQRISVAAGESGHDGTVGDNGLLVIAGIVFAYPLCVSAWPTIGSPPTPGRWRSRCSLLASCCRH